MMIYTYLRSSFEKKATKPARAVPLASARQHLDVETQACHSSERVVESPLVEKIQPKF